MDPMVYWTPSSWIDGEHWIHDDNIYGNDLNINLLEKRVLGQKCSKHIPLKWWWFNGDESHGRKQKITYLGIQSPNVRG